MSQTNAYRKLFRQFWRAVRYFVLGLMVLIALYAVARIIDVTLGSFYEGSRGPYLQMLSDTSVTVRWQSEDAHIGVLRFGVNKNTLDKEVMEPMAVDSHELRLTGLAPLQRYYYQIGNKEKEFSGVQSFVTAASTGSPTAVRFWVTGDQGYRGPIQTDVMNSAWLWLKSNVRADRGLVDFWLTTGDNAYRSGTNTEFQENFFQPYADILNTHVVWPAYGNHDARRWAFFDIFSLPTNAESGGTASHTENYYSFDYGQLHVVMLDSQSNDLSTDGKMATWLQADLKATHQPWRIVVMHHPSYTKGSHDSDRLDDSGARLFEVRENLLPLMERLGVDMVITGHSHMYERSHAMACHYGESSEWKSEFVRDNTSPYSKNRGTVYMVLGSSSKLDNGPLNHPAMPVSLRQAGSVVIDVDKDALTSRFINRQGQLADSFQIVKDTSSNSKRLHHCE